jgi:hypothetical protein
MAVLPIAAAPTLWSFDGMPAGQPPAGFSLGRTGSGRPGHWMVRACGIVCVTRTKTTTTSRANALEDNVCWYYVQNDRRIEVKCLRVEVASGVWHTLRADMRGDHVEVYFNDKKLIDVHDSRFTTPGKVGVWTKADSYTQFDDFTATRRSYHDAPLVQSPVHRLGRGITGYPFAMHLAA